MAIKTYKVYATKTIHLETTIDVEMGDSVVEAMQELIIDDFEETGTDFRVDLVTGS